ncbi:nucleotidyltransferase domain-containing protein [Streptomyces sp. LN549]|uniref:nucleotidyltransferase domain-containing protein n=1 Tax=Streptomyces sp. LN549 TaxID=3112979 RepID=UPI00371E4567
MTENHFPPEIKAEISRICSGLPSGASCIATGSIVEGFGNKNSDIDLYAVLDEEVRGQSTAIGIRKSRYVDCEFMTLGALARLRSHVVEFSWGAVGDRKLADYDRYYRLSIGLPVLVSEPAAEVLALFRVETAREQFARWARFRAFEHLARAATALACRQDEQAGFLLRAGSAWISTSTLADEGEGYPSLKWLGEKAARRHGRGSKAFHELVDDWIRPSGSSADRLARLRDRVDLPPEALRAVTEKSGVLGDGVAYRGGSDVNFLIGPRRRIIRTDHLTSLLCERLGAGISWSEATDDIAAALSVPGSEVAAALWSQTSNLRSNAFIQQTC